MALHFSFRRKNLQLIEKGRQPLTVLVAERLREKFEKYQFQFGELELSFTASFGVCEFNRFDDLDVCLKNVDKNLYTAKASGRNCVVAG